MDGRPTARRAARCRLAYALDRLEDRRMLAVTELITNGNFAANSTGWTLTGDFAADATYTNGRSLPGYAYLAGSGGSITTSNDLVGTISQTFTIPANATSATLTFWYKTTSDETGGSNDLLNVRIKNTSGTTLSLLNSYYPVTNASYVQAGPFNLLPYAGQTIALSFDGSTNATLGTIFRVDDVSLQADVPAPAPAFAAPTQVYPGIIASTGMPTVNTPVPTFRWNAVSGATGYGLALERLSGSTWSTVYNTESGQPYTSPIKGTQFTVPAAFTTGTYRWHVRAFNSTGAVTSYAPYLYFNLAASGWNRAVGIDISNYQTVSNWTSVKADDDAPSQANALPVGDIRNDTSYVFVKATEGVTYVNPQYASQSNGAANVGIPVGAYHFARPDNNAAVDEADHFYATIASRLTAGNLIPMLDFEASAAASLGSVYLTAWANAFCDRLLSLSGLVPIIYSGAYYSRDNLDPGIIRYPLWVAQYDTSSANPVIPFTSAIDNPSLPASPTWPAAAWSMWQYCSTRTVTGISSGNVDSDVANSDVATFYDMFKIPSSLKGSISGTLFNDANSNGVKDAGEAGFSGRSVFLDADNDGVLDSGEATATTNGSGLYTFTNLPAGAYYVRQIVPGTHLATSPASYALQITAGQAVTTRDFGSRPIDTVAPYFATKRFNYDQAGQSITLVLSENTGGTFTAADVSVIDVGTLAAIPFTFAFNSATFTATITPNAPYTNGASYRLSVPAGAYNDLIENPNAADSLDFFVLAGDLNRDRAVNFDDLLVIAQNYGTTTGATFATGDVTFDGQVNFDDLLVLAQGYGSTAVVAATPATTTRRKAVATQVLA